MSRVEGPERRRPRPTAAPADVTVDLDPPARAMAICAHPDDADFFVSGTFAKWSATGASCVYVVLTDGAAGSWDTAAGGRLPAARMEEQRRAAKAAGVAEVVFLGLPDGLLEPHMDLRRRLAGIIRHFRPDVVATHDPWKPYQLHPDHRATGLSACDAVVAARESLVFPDIDGAAHRAARLLLFETDAADHFEDVTATFDVKVEALLAHETQYPTTLDITAPGDEAAFRDRLAAWCADLGSPAGLPLAEAFKQLRP